MITAAVHLLYHNHVSGYTVIMAATRKHMRYPVVLYISGSYIVCVNCNA